LRKLAKGKISNFLNPFQASSIKICLQVKSSHWKNMGKNHLGNIATSIPIIISNQNFTQWALIRKDLKWQMAEKNDRKNLCLAQIVKMWWIISKSAVRDQKRLITPNLIQQGWPNFFIHGPKSVVNQFGGPKKIDLIFLAYFSHFWAKNMSI